MIKSTKNGSTSTPVRGLSSLGYTQGYPILAPLTAPKKIQKNSKECLT